MVPTLSSELARDIRGEVSSADRSLVNRYAQQLRLSTAINRFIRCAHILFGRVITPSPFVLKSIEFATVVVSPRVVWSRDKQLAQS